MPTFEDIQNNIRPFIDEYGIKKVGIFGSYARGQAKETSDIDLLFDFQKEFGIFGLSRYHSEQAAEKVLTEGAVEF